MRKTWTISITSYRGTKYYRLTQRARQAIAGTAFSLCALLCASSVYNVILNNHENEVAQQIAAMESELQLKDRQIADLRSKRSELLASLANRDQQLASLDDSIGTIEELLGLPVASTDPEHISAVNLENRLTQNISVALEKQLLLKSVPRGYPTEDKVVTDGYGNRIHPVTKNKDFHPAVDLRAKMRSKIFATADGIVEVAGRHASGHGIMVKIRHNYGFDTLYSHLNSVNVKAGQFVRQGELIAESGRTGRVSAPHLHYEIHYMGKRLNPTRFLDWNLDEFETLQTNIKELPWDSLEKAIERSSHQPNQRILAQQQLSQPIAISTGTSP